MSKNVAVFGIFPAEINAAGAVEQLKLAGFRNTDVSVLCSENPGNKDLGMERHTKAPEGATTGASSGAILGGALGWLVGAGMLAIPGLGAFVAAGPLLSLLSGAAIVGAAGGLTGAMIGAGIPEYEAKRYEGHIRKGGVLLSVHCDDDHYAHRAKDILRNTGAQDISSASEAKADFGESDKSYPRATPTRV